MDKWAYEHALNSTSVAPANDRQRQGGKLQWTIAAGVLERTLVLVARGREAQD